MAKYYIKSIVPKMVNVFLNKAKSRAIPDLVSEMKQENIKLVLSCTMLAVAEGGTRYGDAACSVAVNMLQSEDIECYKFVYNSVVKQIVQAIGDEECRLAFCSKTGKIVTVK